MDGIFSLENLFTLMMLIFLQAVLGFDNLLYISIESKRVSPERQAFVRRLGIGLAIVCGLLCFSSCSLPWSSSWRLLRPLTCRAS